MILNDVCQIDEREPSQAGGGELTGSRCAVITVWTTGVKRRRETEAEMPGFNAGLGVSLGVRR